MARKPRRKSNHTLQGAEEFAGPDTEKEAIEKIAAAKAAAATEAEQDKKKGDNGGPPLDEAAWRRACNEYVAEMLEMEKLEEQKSEVAGRISSVRKVAKKLGVDWDVVKRYYADHKRVRKGTMGEMVTEERRYRWLLKVMGSPLGTEFTLWDFADEAGDKPDARPGMDAELQGQHAYSNNEPLTNNPFTQGTEEYFDWAKGWRNKQDATARGMGPPPAANGAEATATI